MSHSNLCRSQAFAVSEAKFGGNKLCREKVANIKKAVRHLFGNDLQTPCHEAISVQLSHRTHAIIAGKIIKGGGQLWNPEQHGPQVSDGVRHEILSEAEVEQQLEELLSQCNGFINNSEKLTQEEKFKVAAYFIYRYLAIHPYSDGNGRVARLLTWLLLIRLGAVSQPLRLDLAKNSRRRYVKGLNQGRVTDPSQSGQLKVLQSLMLEAAA